MASGAVAQMEIIELPSGIVDWQANGALADVYNPRIVEKKEDVLSRMET